MNISLDLYRVFYIVAKMGSISAAANILFISQPAISFQIKKLEEQLGVSLFTRTKHGVILTDGGRVLFDYVKSALESINNGENVISNLKNLDVGTIRIGVSTTICRYVLMPHLEKFHKMYPKIEIQINNNLSSNLLKELRNGNLDILVMFLPLNKNNDMKYIPLLDVEDIFVGSREYYDLEKDIIDLKELAKYPLIFPTLSSNSRLHLNKYLSDNDCSFRPRLEVVSYSLIIDLVKAGFGIGYVTREFVADELEKKLLYEIRVFPAISKRTIVIVVPDKKELSYSVKKFIQLLLSKSV